MPDEYEALSNAAKTHTPNLHRNATLFIGHPDIGIGSSMTFGGEIVYVSVAEAIYRERHGTSPVRIYLSPYPDTDFAFDARIERYRDRVRESRAREIALRG